MQLVQVSRDFSALSWLPQAARGLGLPIDLLRAQYFMSRDPLAAGVVVEIVDVVSLPLIRAV